ncbi:ArsC family reductase [Acetobacter estunensis]|nr:ArsC family reductase [Acetobacter estunensis]
MPRRLPLSGVVFGVFHVWFHEEEGDGQLSVTLYGIRNCDTMKKARAWLDAHDVAYVFHDYRKDGLDPDRLKAWIKNVGWEALLNRAGTTFRKLLDDAKADLNDQKAMALMEKQPAMIRRPVLETAKGLEIGFRPERYESLFAG